ncbi:hypothetical protein RRG08_039118, partial [Elysia crispata]
MSAPRKRVLHDEALTVELHAEGVRLSVGDSVAEISPRKGSPLRPWEIRPPFCCTVMIDAGLAYHQLRLAGRGVDGVFSLEVPPTVASGFACPTRLKLTTSIPIVENLYSQFGETAEVALSQESAKQFGLCRHPSKVPPSIGSLEAEQASAVGICRSEDILRPLTAVCCHQRSHIPH